MKTKADVENRLRAELNVWFNRQARNPFAAFHLYYRESTPEAEGGFLICEEPPANESYKLGSQRIGPGSTTDQWMNTLKPIVMQLPILNIGE